VAEKLTPDICVIGAGSGGLSVAAAAAAFGVPVVLIERGKMGGDCLNTGCVPSKALLAAAKRAASMRGDALGVLAERVAIDFGAVRAHVNGVIAAIAPVDSAERFIALGVHVIKGEARFTDRKTVAVGDYEIAARRFVIATGSRATVPPIPGLDKTPYFTNETIFDLTELPKHLVVIGAGPIGLELAQAFRRLGSDVTVIEAAQPLAKDDPECTAVVLDQLRLEGVAIHAGAKIERVAGSAGKIEMMMSGGEGGTSISGTHLLVAAGRTPTLDALNLDAAGIKCKDGKLVLNRGLKTSNRHIYAIGDVAGRAQFTHAANYHAGIVIRSALFRLPAMANEDAIPRVTYTDPELAHTGMTEAEARKRGHSIRVLRWPYHDNDRAQAEGRTRGHIKVVTTKRGKILGATIVGAEAGELITAWTLAISQRLNIRAFTAMVVPYPTLSEIGKRAAIDFFTPSLTSPWVRRIIMFLRKFG
jgi:pyruvate/2-oxoglutarate dehydrogenase complex dihydrolipoamide dehydrogenase (E3) component